MYADEFVFVQYPYLLSKSSQCVEVLPAGHTIDTLKQAEGIVCLLKFCICDSETVVFSAVIHPVYVFRMLLLYHG